MVNESAYGSAQNILDVAIANDEDALAQIYGDEQTISIAAGISQPISKAPAVASVITASDIRRMGARDIVDVLETIPGVHVARDTISNSPIITFRGIYSESNAQVLMLINTIPITNLFRGNRGQVWAGMPVESIARIEVIRGPGSAIYGAEAFAGVIDIVTKDAKDINGSSFGVRAGSFDSQDAWFMHGKNYAGFDVALMAEFGTTDGHHENVDSDFQTMSDALLGTNASLAPGSTNNGRDNIDLRLDVQRDNWTLRGGLQRRRNVEVGFGVGGALDPYTQYDSDRLNADLTYKNLHVSDSWGVQAQVSYLNVTQEIDEDTILFPPGAYLVLPPPAAPVGPFANGVIGNPEVWEKHWRFNSHVEYSGLDDHALRFGVGYSTSEIYRVRESNNFSGVLVDVTDTDAAFLPEKHRDNKYFMMQDVWSIADDWELTTGLRHDNYNDFGSTWNPRAALVWSAGYDTSVKFLYGQAFRAPSFAEFRNRGNPVALGNDELDPEKIESFEVAVISTPVNDLTFGANVFYYKWDDIIQFIPDATTGTSTAENIGEQNGYGFELEMEWVPNSDFLVSANYAYQDSENSNDENSGNAPKHHINLQGNWQFFPGWYLAPAVNFIIDRERSSGDARDDLDDYAVVDLTLQNRTFNNKWEVAAGVRNLFNSSPEEPTIEGLNISNDLPLQRRNVFVELRMGFE